MPAVPEREQEASPHTRQRRRLLACEPSRCPPPEHGPNPQVRIAPAAGVTLLSLDPRLGPARRAPTEPVLWRENTPKHIHLCTAPCDVCNLSFLRCSFSKVSTIRVTAPRSGVLTDVPRNAGTRIKGCTGVLSQRTCRPGIDRHASAYH